MEGKRVRTKGEGLRRFALSDVGVFIVGFQLRMCAGHTAGQYCGSVWSGVSSHFYSFLPHLPLAAIHFACIEMCQADYALVEIDWLKIARSILYIYIYIYIYIFIYLFRRYQRLCGLRHWSTAAGLLGLWVRILPGSWMSFYCYCNVLSGRGLWARPEDS